MHNLSRLFETLNLRPKTLDLYQVAFTHSSCNVSEHYRQDYERLEFIGDAVLSFVVAALIYKIHGATLDQGKMTKMRSELVQKKSLARYAGLLGFQAFIQFGPSIKVDEQQNQRFLEDVFEAFIGALYLDLGIKVASQFITKIFKIDIVNFTFDTMTDYKSELQEAIQAENRDAVQYRIVKEEGPSHDKTYTIEVYLDDICLGVGVGKTKKAAQQQAAKAALEKKAG